MIALDATIRHDLKTRYPLQGLLHHVPICLVLHTKSKLVGVFEYVRGESKNVVEMQNRYMG